MTRARITLTRLKNMAPESSELSNGPLITLALTRQISRYKPSGKGIRTAESYRLTTESWDKLSSKLWGMPWVKS